VLNATLIILIIKPHFDAATRRTVPGALASKIGFGLDPDRKPQPRRSPGAKAFLSRSCIYSDRHRGHSFRSGRRNRLFRLNVQLRSLGVKRRRKGLFSSSGWNIAFVREV
jgi:hypothetical protein